MGVQLNIKDAETIRLARELAGGSGRSVTAVIRAALEREWRERQDEAADRRRAAETMLAGVAELWLPEWRDRTSQEIMDSLYDDDGLPV